ncbi:MAG: glycosyltransferase [Campylobacteraceae bacterium]|jgi:spore maturation protein CgeB|nr:glycosyltransferase [Campylobacteraceae bacterium]
MDKKDINIKANTKTAQNKKIYELKEKMGNLRIAYEKEHENNELLKKIVAVYEEKIEENEKNLNMQNELKLKEIAALKKELEAERTKFIAIANDLKNANDKYFQAEKSLIQLRASITYQLGYQLINRFKTLRGAIGLPFALFDIYREFKRRKLAKKHNIHRANSIDTQNSNIHINIPINDISKPELLQESKRIYPLIVKNDIKNKLRVAAIMDDFTFNSYCYECNIKQLTPDNWNIELEEFEPELLFIESAWRGKDELWEKKVGHNSEELQQIVTWCKNKNIPTVFWNKEDPIHLETFLNTAKQFDFVFTTDIDCIHRYKAALGHERVYLLLFALQPAVHNPIELYKRKDAFCFAGAYYVKYPERTRDLGNFISLLPDFYPVEIYDRNFGKNDANYQFPKEYYPFIAGTLSFKEIDMAYKGYKYAINFNSIKQSQSMFARRVYELLGCNTITVSNFSRGLRLMFGDLVISADNAKGIISRVQYFSDNNEYADKFRLAALRKVMMEHTYEERLNYILSKVNNQKAKNSLPNVAVLAFAKSEDELKSILSNFKRQSYSKASMYVLLDKNMNISSNENSHIYFINYDKAKNKKISEIVDGAVMISGICPEDYYGKNYLLDLVLATKYTKAKVIGKASYYQHTNDEFELINKGKAYHIVNSLELRNSIAYIDVFQNEKFVKFLETLPNSRYDKTNSIAIDPYNYCKYGNKLDNKKILLVDDIEIDTGLSINELLQEAESIMPSNEPTDNISKLDVNKLQEIFGVRKSKRIIIEQDEFNITINSSMKDGEHEYIYAAKYITPNDLGVKEGKINFFLETTIGLNIMLTILFFDAQKQRISHEIKTANCNHTVAVPTGTEYIRLGWRIFGSGAAQIQALFLSHKDIGSKKILSKTKYLLITNIYPSYENLYRNGFVHSRIKEYKERGIDVDVFCLRTNESISYYEFENIDVIAGSKKTLCTLLDGKRYESVLVHFLNIEMWDVLKEYEMDITVWIHGSEIQPWWRRKYNYTTQAQFDAAKIESEKRFGFWQGLLREMPKNLKLVFVSRYFAKEVMEDLGFDIPKEKYSIIHNPINTKLFSYEIKPAEQRLKILSIRPYSSAIYANDLSAKAIEILSQKPFFKELEFRMMGNGALFDEVLTPLKKYPNIFIEKRFLSQQEISKLHKQYGIFLCPTRLDSQGVSRDEAMASGLVPITNGVAAIPEFVDNECGFLAAAESAQEIADAIEFLYNHPDKFLQMSEAAVKRVKRQSSSDIVVEQELKQFVKKQK